MGHHHDHDHHHHHHEHEHAHEHHHYHHHHRDHHHHHHRHHHHHVVILIFSLPGNEQLDYIFNYKLIKKLSKNHSVKGTPQCWPKFYYFMLTAPLTLNLLFCASSSSSSC